MTALSAITFLDAGVTPVAPAAATRLKALVHGPGTCAESAPILVVAETEREMLELQALYPGASWVTLRD